VTDWNIVGLHLWIGFIVHRKIVGLRCYFALLLWRITAFIYTATELVIFSLGEETHERIAIAQLHSALGFGWRDILAIEIERIALWVFYYGIDACLFVPL
jgi:hypothetical protein